jgi:hypothetical protein
MRRGVVGAQRFISKMQLGCIYKSTNLSFASFSFAVKAGGPEFVATRLQPAATESRPFRAHGSLQRESVIRIQTPDLLPVTAGGYGMNL